MISKRIIAVGSLSLLTLLAACSPPPRVEVVERSVSTVRAETEKIGGSIIRIVQSGDTLHAIAFGAGLNVNEVAAWNKLEDTSTLKVGQHIRLTRPLNFQAPVKSVIRKTENTSTQPDTATARQSTRPIESQPLGTQKSQTNSAKGQPSSIPQLSNARPSNQGSSIVRQSSRSTSTPHVIGSPTWSWPAQGPVIGRFLPSKGQQGIDIQGQQGQPVVASEGGEVVYVGNGLKGYGNLVIIKHNEQYLSAYAHNQKIHVQEGQRVSARHAIGSIGRDKKGRLSMHFQIRKDGKPINPLSLLPGR